MDLESEINFKLKGFCTLKYIFFKSIFFHSLNFKYVHLHINFIFFLYFLNILENNFYLVKKELPTEEDIVFFTCRSI